MREDVQKGRDFSERFYSAVVRLVAKDLRIPQDWFTHATDHDDMRHLGDLLINVRGEGNKIYALAVRVRRGGCGYFDKDFTVRGEHILHPGGMTEEKKILAGYGKYFFYALTEDDLTIARYRLLSLDVFRSSGVKPYRTIANRAADDTYFSVYSWEDFPENLLLGGSALPRKVVPIKKERPLLPMETLFV